MKRIKVKKGTAATIYKSLGITKAEIKEAKIRLAKLKAEGLV